MTPVFWQGKRVLLTGHTGFKGSWMSLWLQSLGSNLQGFSLTPPTSPSLFDVAKVGQSMRSEIGDIRDFEHVRRVVEDFRPEIVIHMAAQPLVRYSYKYPIDTYATNVMGTVHVLEAVRQVGTAKVVINITTDKCYENREWVWGYREDEAMGGHDPYSSSKGCVELVSAAYRRSFLQEAGIALATARAGNVIGGGDWAEDRLIPDMLRAFEQGTPAVIRNLLATRPWQHVLEPLSGYLTLAERLWHEPVVYAEGWNFGPRDEDAKPVAWIVSELSAKWSGGTRWQLDDAPQPHEADCLKLDTSKARNRLGWGPRWSLEQALEKTVTWHKAWLANDDMRQSCLRQIREYQDTPIKY